MKSLPAIALAAVCVFSGRAQDTFLTDTNYATRNATITDDTLTYLENTNNLAHLRTMAGTIGVLFSNRTARGAWTFKDGSVTITNGSGTDALTLKRTTTSYGIGIDGANLRITDGSTDFFTWNPATTVLTLVGNPLTFIGDTDFQNGIKGVHVSSDNTTGQSGTQAGLTFKDGLFVGGTFTGTNAAATATNAIANSGGFGTNTTLVGNTAATNITASGFIRSAEYQASDGSVGVTRLTTGFDVEQGIVTEFAAPTGSGGLVQSNAPTITSATLTSPTITSMTADGGTVTGLLEINLTNPGANDGAFEVLSDSNQKFVIRADGSAISQSWLELRGLTNNGVASIPTNSANFHVITNGLDGLSGLGPAEGAVQTNGNARAIVRMVVSIGPLTGSTISLVALYAQDGGSGAYSQQDFYRFQRTAGTATEYTTVTLTAFVDPNSRWYWTNTTPAVSAARMGWSVKNF